MTTICKKYKSGSFIEKRGEQENALCLKRFNGSKGGQAFSFKRPAFRAGAIEHDKHIKPLLPNSREGLGNRGITRSNFEAPAIRGREALNFERLQAQDISEGGIKVRLGDKTIEKLFKIQVDDPSDIKWIEEYQARIAGGETDEQIKLNPPMGRPQRKISQMKNFAAQGLSVDDKIETLKSAVLQGNADNRTEMAQIIATTAGLLGNLGNLRNITQTGMNNLSQTIRRMSIPKHWRAMGFTHRLMTLSQYRQQAGLINLYLLSNLSNLPNDRTFEQPLVIYNDQGDIRRMSSITRLEQLLTSETRQQGGVRVRYPALILDLQTKGLITQNSAIMLANSGTDNGQLNGQAPPAGPPNNGAWLPNVIFRWDYPGNVPAGVQTQGV